MDNYNDKAQVWKGVFCIKLFQPPVQFCSFRRPRASRFLLPETGENLRLGSLPWQGQENFGSHLGRPESCNLLSSQVSGAFALLIKQRKDGGDPNNGTRRAQSKFLWRWRSFLLLLCRTLPFLHLSNDSSHVKLAGVLPDGKPIWKLPCKCVYVKIWGKRQTVSLPFPARSGRKGEGGFHRSYSGSCPFLLTT